MPPPDKLELEFQAAALELAQKKAEDELMRPNQLLSKNMLIERFQKELEEAFLAKRKEQNHGATLLAASLEEIKKENPELFSDAVNEQISRLASLSEFIEKNEETFTKQLEEGGTLQDLVQVDQATMDILYLAARRLIDLKLFDDAADAFRFLIGLNPKKYVYWLGLAETEYRRKHFKEALEAFLLISEANPQDPTPLLAACRCCKETGQLDLALQLLDRAEAAKPELRDTIKQERAHLMQIAHGR